MNSRFSLAAVVASASLSVLASPALAADAWTVDLTAASQYMSKGAGKSDGEFHAAITVERAFGAGYAGLWAGNVDTSKGADAEVQLYAGVKPKLGPVGFDLRAYYKTLPGTQDGVQEDLLEFRADASAPLAGSKVRLRVEYSQDSYAAVEQAWWIEAQVSRKLNSQWTASAAYARREQVGGADYWAWNAGVRYAVTPKIAADLRWYDTDSHGFGDNYDGRVVAAVSKSF